MFKNSFIYKIYKYYIIDSIIILKNEGFRILLRKRGTKFIMIIVGYYLIRDSILYIIIPYLIASGIMDSIFSFSY